MTGTAVLLFAVGGVAITGCGGEGDGSGEPPAGPRTRQVEMSDFQFTPAQVRVAKDASLAIRNGGSEGHDLKLRRDGKEIGGTEILNPGETQQLMILYDEGRYEMYCSVPGHEKSGMAGTFVVD